MYSIEMIIAASTIIILKIYDYFTVLDNNAYKHCLLDMNTIQL